MRRLKPVSVRAMKARGGGTGIAIIILNLGARRRCEVSITPGSFTTVPIE